MKLYLNNDISVVDTETHRQLLFGDWVQSSLEHGSIRSGLAYVEGFHLAMMAAGDVGKVLFVGGGGCVGPIQFQAMYPGLAIDVIEISSEIAMIAREYFGYTGNIIVADARDVDCRGYDLVLMDAYGLDGGLVSGIDTGEAVVMTNSLDGSMFSVPGKRQKLFLTGAKPRLAAYDRKLLPNLEDIWRSL